MIQTNRSTCGLLASVLFLVGTLASAAPATPSASANLRWGANYFPNITLTTHDGKKVRFFDDLIKDKVVVINFIYTSCPDTCPLETAKLLEVQRILGDRVGRDVFMYSISIDPKTDTPEVLKKYVELYEIGPGWTFLTGDEDDITLLRKRFGLYLDDIQDGSLNHNLSMVIGNQATGRWMKSSPFENPYYLARRIGGWLHNWKTPSKTNLDYANAPKLRDVSKGESLYRTRCAACHTIGGGDILQPAQRRVGPDLLGVVQMRDRAWLGRWLAEPEKMLREGDPIAMGLLAKYKGLPMPNMRLNNKEVDRLIDYIDKEGRRVENVRRLRALLPTGKDGELKACCSRKTDLTLAGDKIQPQEPTAHLDEAPQSDADTDESRESQRQRRGFLTPSMVAFGVLGFTFLLLARRFRQTR